MRNYWWLEVIRDVEKYVDRCDLCQRIKNQMEAPAEKLMANEMLEKLWMYLMVDFITKLLLVAERNIILVVCDRLSKIVYFIATIKETSAEGLARLFRNNVWKLHRLLEGVILD